MTVEKAMRMRCLAVALLALLTACAHDLPRYGAPERVWASPRSLDNAMYCIIAALDERGRSASSLSPGMTHRAQAVVPGKVHEIRAEQELAVMPENYLVRLEKIDDRITRISLFAQSPWKKELIRVISPCGTRS